MQADPVQTRDCEQFNGDNAKEDAGETFVAWGH
jgi:hypothetical protein